MKVLYELQTPWPTDIKNPDGLDAVDWHQEGQIPFVPHAGMEIDCGDGDFRTVKDVYWCAEEPEQIAIWFGDDEMARTLKYWTSGGWKTKDLDIPEGEKTA